MSKHEQPEQETLHRVLTVARQLSAEADLKRILAVIIDAVRDLLSAERATVFEYDAEARELFSTVAHGLASGPDQAEAEIRLPINAGLAGQCAGARRIINVPDAHGDPRFNVDIDKRTGFRTRQLLSIPLIDHEGELVGVVQVLNRRRGEGPFTEQDEEIAEALSSHAAVALKRGRLMEDRLVREKLERDIELARRIQQSSFPERLPSLEGFQIEAWSKPAEQTGGDMYDVIGLVRQGDELHFPEEGAAADRAVLLMADATGHGVGPALSVAQVRSMLRMAVRLGADLANVASHMNQQLAADLPAGRFVTAWLGELDARQATLASLSAGQGPLLRYCAADDRFQRISADTAPLGVLDDLNISIANRFAMATGDIFAVVSDGVFEAIDKAGEEFGIEGVEEVIRSSRFESAEQIIRALRQAVERFIKDQPARDDQTVIVVKRMQG